MIKKNKGNLLEQHAEKIVLVVVAIISAILLWRFVLTSPNAVTLGAAKLGPGEVDRYIKTKADELDAALKGDPVLREYVPRAVNNYIAKLDNTLEKVPDFHIPGVIVNPQAVEEDRRYAMPLVVSGDGDDLVIGRLDKVAAEAIRGVAHVPLDEIGPENPYDKAMTQLNDIDLVTVQASFDIAALHRNFIQSFIMGRDVKNEWKDEELATPVFASVQLQRRRLLEGGGWSTWEVVERPKIDQYRAKLNVPEKVGDLAYDINVQKTQFKAFEFQRNLLQPKPYRFASSNAVWLTPSFHKEYVKIEERDKKEALREERERARDERARDRGAPLGYETTRGRSRTTRTGSYSDYGEGAYDGRARSRQSVRGRRSNDPRRRRDMTGAGGYYEEGDEFGYGTDYPRRGRQDRTVDDVISDNIKIIIHQGMRLEEMREPLVFWAHDDMVEPGNTYQYRIRLGVFNPIAGKNWFYQQEQKYKDQVILWSAFSDVSEEIAVAPRVYFFPTDIARDSDNAVTIDVFKYYLGNWRNEAFDVHPGEMIGKTVDFKPQRPIAGARDTFGEYDYDMGSMMPTTMPGKIDFSTGAMLVDVVKTNAWTGLRSLVRTKMADVLYTRDGVNMLHLPVKRNNWTGAMKVQYAKVEEASRESIDLQQGQAQRKVDIFQQRGGIYSPLGPRGRMIEGRGEYDYAGEEDYMDSRMGGYRPGRRGY